MHTSKRSFWISYFLIFALLLSGCNVSQSSASENTRFKKFTKDLFCQEVSSNTINLHYTLQNPSTYELENVPVTYGQLSTDDTAAQAAVENYQSVLTSFQRNRLSSENQLTYDVLDFYLNVSALGAKYLLYQEPLSPVSGTQSQLPVVLSEYQFNSVSDVDTYLTLLEDTTTYFQSVINFEKAKAESGLFMSDDQLDEILSQCQAFVNSGADNYLYSTFEERIETLDELSVEEKDAYITANATAIEVHVFPAYQLLISELNTLYGKGLNDKGLCYLPQGKKYYEYLIRQSAGLSESVSELQELAKEQMLSDLQTIEKIVLTTSATDESVLDFAEPSSLLNNLKTKITTAFPAIPEVTVEIKYVPASMEEYLSPAFYMIPALDNSSENVIYINQGQVPEGLNLYTTLAHEGYPGHLYQTVYYHSKNPDPIRSFLDFGGYVEGWATYAEMMSYYLAPLTREEATILQKNNSLILGLYAYADMGIHYDGWGLNEMARFFRNYGITDAQTLQAIYQLIIGSPANYLKYYMGYVKFYHLKQEIAARLGDDFSQKTFHQTVLDVGPAPFSMVETYTYEHLLHK